MAFENAQRDIVTLYPAISYLEEDDTNNTSTLKDTLLKVAVKRGQVYTLEAVMTFQSDTLNNGIGIAFKLPTDVNISFQWLHNHTVRQFEGGYNIASEQLSSATESVPVINENVPLTGFGIVKADADGDIVLQFMSEGAHTVTLKGGLCALRLMQIV